MFFVFGCGIQLILSQTCGKSRLGRGLGHYDGEGGGGWRRLGPGQGPVPGEAYRQSSCFHRGLVVSQLVDPLLLQQQSLLLMHPTHIHPNVYNCNASLLPEDGTRFSNNLTPRFHASVITQI